MLKLFLSWLERVPAADVVDRRNAAIMQVLFFTVGITLPISWARHLAALSVPEGWLVVMAMDMIVATLAFACVFMIRGGRLRMAVAIFLSALLLGLLLGYLKLGFQTHSVDQTSQMLSLVISGLVLGRRALWAVFAALMVIFTGGFWIDAMRAQETGGAAALSFHFLPSAVFSYFVITLVLDRSVTALRESLRESETRRVQLQREMVERERAQSQLVHSQKMEATGRLASGVAHDFNNILSVVLGLTAVRLRLDDPDADPRQDAIAMADALAHIEHSAQLGVSLSRKLLCFSRRDPVNAEFFDAGQALTDLRPILRQLFPASISLVLRSDDQLTPIFMDKGQFELMILNIASNARDAMPEGGEFQIIASVDAASETVEIRLSDNGHGIEQDIQSQVFEPFFSTKPADRGTGLGLAVTHTLVAAADGSIELDSASGCGTTFCIRLPMAHQWDAQLAPVH